MNIKFLLVGLGLIVLSFILDSSDLFPKAVNFFILLGILIYFGRKPITEMLRASIQGRSAEYFEHLSKAEDAKEKLDETLDKIKNMESELEGYKESILKQAQVEKAKTIAEAEFLASNIEKQAQERVKSMMEQAKKDIRKYILENAVNEAVEDIRSGKVKIGTSDQALKDISGGLEK